MNTAPLFEIFNTAVNLLILVFAGYYFLKFRKKEKALQKKESATDIQYHQIVNDALSKERKILDDATHAADRIITGANYVNKETKEEVYNALQSMGNDLQKEAEKVARDFLGSYRHSLNQITASTISGLDKTSKDMNLELQKQNKNFQDITIGIHADLQKRIKEFHEVRLSALEKELDEYKQERLKQTEKIISVIIHEASQEILNKSISLEDHQALLLESFEKAKKKGLLD